MAEAANDERGASGEARDYSRPVGWWCAYCGNGTVGAFHTVMCPHPGVHVPRYLPIPKGQRPPAASEVEEAEVVTSYSAPSSSTPFTVVRSGNRAETVLEGMDLAATVQRIVTGATE